MNGSSVIFAGDARIDGNAFMGAYSQFDLAVGSSRRDARTPRGTIVRAKREEMNARRIDAALRVVHGDGFNSNAGFHLSRQLEYIHKEVLEEQYPIPNGLRLFAESGTVPVGAQTHTMSRVYSHGEAVIHRGQGTVIPRVGVTQREETFQIKHVVAGHGWNIFEAAAANFANSGLIRQLQRVNRDAILEKINRILWQGSEADGLYGVLSYPWLAKRVMAVSFTKAAVLAAPDATLAALHELCNFPAEVSKSTFAPDTLVLTNAVRDVLSTVRFAAGSDTTILKHFLENSAHIKRIETAWELEDAGGAGVDGILAYRSDARGIQSVMPEGVTMLPVQEKGLESEVIMHASCGGVIMPDVRCNVLGLATT